MGINGGACIPFRSREAATENCPPIHRWVSALEFPSPRRDDRNMEFENFIPSPIAGVKIELFPRHCL